MKYPNFGVAFPEACISVFRLVKERFFGIVVFKSQFLSLFSFLPRNPVELFEEDPITFNYLYDQVSRTNYFDVSHSLLIFPISHTYSDLQNCLDVLMFSVDRLLISLFRFQLCSSYTFPSKQKEKNKTMLPFVFCCCCCFFIPMATHLYRDGTCSEKLPKT